MSTTPYETRAALESRLPRGATYSDQDLKPFALGVEWALEQIAQRENDRPLKMALEALTSTRQRLEARVQELDAEIERLHESLKAQSAAHHVEVQEQVAAERERIAREFDRRDKGVGGFYDPHEPAEIIRAMTPDV